MSSRTNAQQQSKAQVDSKKNLLQHVFLLVPVTILVYLIDTLLLEMMSATRGSATGNRTFMVEMGTVVMCMITPVVILRWGKSRGKTKQETSQRGGFWKRLSHGGEADSNSRGPRGKMNAAEDLSSQDSAISQGEDLSTADARRTGQSTVGRSQLTAAQERARKLASVAKWNQAINASVRAGDQEKAERLLHEIHDAGLQPDAISYNSVIHACAKRGDIIRAEMWLMKMRASGVSPNTISYNILMDACVKADDAEAAERWLTRMTDDGVAPNEVSFATLIHARAKHGSTELAEQWLHRMLSAGVEPNIVSYNSLIYACGRQGNVDGAEKWVKEVEQRGLSARVTTYTAVVDACAKSGDVLRAEKWMEKMIENKVEPNVVSYSAMIDACAKASEPARAEKWHRRMLENGVRPNAHTFSAVISSCAKAGDVPTATEHLRRMEEAQIPADVVVYSSVLDACAKVGDTECATLVFEQMRAHDIRPNVVAYASLARAFAHRGDWAEVEQLAHMMTCEGLSMNEYFLYALLLAYATARPRQAERAEAAFLEARAMGLEANKHVLAALGRAVGRVRCHQLADGHIDTQTWQSAGARTIKAATRQGNAAWSGGRSGKHQHSSNNADS